MGVNSKIQEGGGCRPHGGKSAENGNKLVDLKLKQLFMNEQLWLGKKRLREKLQ